MPAAAMPMAPMAPHELQHDVAQDATVPHISLTGLTKNVPDSRHNNPHNVRVHQLLSPLPPHQASEGSAPAMPSPPPPR